MLGVVNTSILKYFLYESYSIEKHTEFLTKIQSLDDDEVTEALIDNELKNMFLFRIDNDPGLHYHVISEAKTDKDLLEKIHSIILQLYGKTVEFDKIFEEKPADLLLEYINDYLRYRLGDAIDKSESNERILAINTLLDMYDRNKCNTDIIADNILYKHILPNNPAKLGAKCNQYIAQNIRYSKMYSRYSDLDRKIDHINEIFSIYNSYFSFYREILSAIFRMDPFSSEVYDSFSDFRSDLMTIIHAEWFMSLERKGKIECLNANYPFNVKHVRSLMTERKKLVGIDHKYILYFVEKMHDTGRYDLASEFCSFLENGSEKYYYPNFSPELYNHDYTEFYENEIKCFQFERAKKIAENILELDPNHSIWHKYVTLSYELCAKEDRREFCNNYLRSLRYENEIVFLKLLLSMSITECEGKITDEVKSELKYITEFLHNAQIESISILDYLFEDIFPIISVWKNDDKDELKISFLSEVTKIFYRAGFSMYLNMPVESLIARMATGHKLGITAEAFLKKTLKYRRYNREVSYNNLISLKVVLNKSSEAKKLGYKALSKYPDSFLIRISMSKLFLNEAEYGNALRFLNEAEELMRNTDENQLAEIIKMSGETFEDPKQIVESLKDKISSFKGEYISFHKIKKKSSTAYWMIQTGDDQYFEKYRELEDKPEQVSDLELEQFHDCSSILIQYGKGIERLLDDIVTKRLRRCIKQDEYNKLRIKQLKRVLGAKKESVSLGYWQQFYIDLSNIRDENLKAKLCSKYDSLLSVEDRKKLEICCAELSLPRNSAAHVTYNSKDDVITKRKNIVYLINSIIDITEKIPSH